MKVVNTKLVNMKVVNVKEAAEILLYTILVQCLTELSEVEGGYAL